jgi:hypothetical protein
VGDPQRRSELGDRLADPPVAVEVLAELLLEPLHHLSDEVLELVQLALELGQALVLVRLSCGP